MATDGYEAYMGLVMSSGTTHASNQIIVRQQRMTTGFFTPEAKDSTACPVERIVLKARGVFAWLS